MGGLWLSACCWLSGRALAAQARGVLGSTLSDCWPFHSPLFSPHNILNFFIFSVRQDVLSMPRSGQSSVKSVNLFFSFHQWTKAKQRRSVSLKHLVQEVSEYTEVEVGA